MCIITITLAILHSLIIVNTIKVIWGRVRFRDLTPPNYPEYTPWYIINGPDLNNLSFISGHTAMGWQTLPLLFAFKGTKKHWKITGYCLIIGWGFFVGISRILVEAHYASDVLFASGFAIVITIFLYKILYLQKKSY